MRMVKIVVNIFCRGYLVPLDFRSPYILFFTMHVICKSIVMFVNGETNILLYSENFIAKSFFFNYFSNR